MATQRDTDRIGASAWVRRLAVAGFLLALAAYAVGALDSPLLDAERRAQVSLLTRYAGSGKRDEAHERVLAEAYWARYADVADNAYFGRQGLLGVWGAREHYDRHGRREGRVWGDQR